MAMPHRRRGTALFMVVGMEDKSVEILRRLRQLTPVVASRVSHSIPATFHNQQIPPRSLSRISIPDRPAAKSKSTSFKHDPHISHRRTAHKCLLHRRGCTRRTSWLCVGSAAKNSSSSSRNCSIRPGSRQHCLGALARQRLQQSFSPEHRPHRVAAASLSLSSFNHLPHLGRVYISQLSRRRFLECSLLRYSHVPALFVRATNCRTPRCSCLRMALGLSPRWRYHALRVDLGYVALRASCHNSSLDDSPHRPISKAVALANVRRALGRHSSHQSFSWNRSSLPFDLGSAACTSSSESLLACPSVRICIDCYLLSALDSAQLWNFPSRNSNPFKSSV